MFGAKNGLSDSPTGHLFGVVRARYGSGMNGDDRGMQYTVRVSEQAFRELVLATLEAYVIPERKARNSRARSRQETYGLLWGHEAQIAPDRRLYYIDAASVDAMAQRSQRWVIPSKRTLDLKTSVIRHVFRHLDFLGDFHSHPSDSLKTVQDGKIYEFSQTDMDHICDDAEFWIRQRYRVALVMTICPIAKGRFSKPRRLRSNIVEFGVGEFRLWLNAIVAHANGTPKGLSFTRQSRGPVTIEIPYVLGGAEHFERPPIPLRAVGGAVASGRYRR
jgi:hypothetical protein